MISLLLISATLPAHVPPELYDESHAQVVLSPFNRVEVVGCDTLDILPGSTSEAVLQGPADVLNHVELSVRNGILRVSRRNAPCDGSRAVATVVVRTSSLKRIDVTGSAHVHVLHVDERTFRGTVAGSGILKLDSVRSASASLDLSGAGQIEIARADFDDLKVVAAGAGSVRIAGRARAIAIDQSGFGNVDVRRLSYEEIKSK